MMNRRQIFSTLAGAAAFTVLAGQADATENIMFDFLQARKGGTGKKLFGGKGVPNISYSGAKEVDYDSVEKPGTIIIKTSERALYRILGDGRAMRFMVAVGKEGFSWAGVARVGAKRENPRWTPPPEMIKRSPQYAKWANGMPGGPGNPLGPRAMYLFNKSGDTGFRIHGTIHPESIGHAASSGCIRMLNEEVIKLYDDTKIGTKVIVI